MVQDLRHGARMLIRQRGFTLIAVLTLALGVGANTAIFSLAYQILLSDLPYPESDRLVALSLTHSAAAAAGVSRFRVNAGNWEEWRALSRSFADIALVRPGVNFNLTGDGSPERVRGAKVSSNLLQVLGTGPLFGRSFTEEEALRDAKVVLLAYGFWDRRYARDPNIIGRRIHLNSESYEVIGVLPQAFGYPARDIDLLSPLFIPPGELRTEYNFHYRAVGRLEKGVSIEQAQAEAEAITLRWSERFPQSGGNRYGVWLASLRDDAVGDFRSVLYVLGAAVGGLLLVGCINLGGLLAVRASSRTREFAIRAALGASASRLLRQTIAEALPLGVAGALGGLLLAWWLIEVSRRWLPPQLPGSDTIGLHLPALLFALALGLIVVLLAGMIPSRLVARAQSAGSLARRIEQESRASTGGGAMRSAVAAAQMAITLVLIFAVSLLGRSLVEVLKVDPGFSPESVLTLQLQVTRAEYPTDSALADYYHRLVARVKNVPGVTEAGMVNALPFSGSGVSGPVEFEGQTDSHRLAADGRSATPGYFAAMGIPLIGGRDFTEHDNEKGAGVGIIDEQMARRAFGGENPIGKRFRFGVITNSTPWIEIVGVVGHIRYQSLESDPRPQVYWPQAQPRPEAQQSRDQAALVIRTSGRPEAFASAILEEIRRENPNQPVYDLRSMEEWLDRSLQSRKLLTGLVALFGVSALLLACLGLYGVVSYGVGLRLREFAIRMALGADASDLRRMVVARALLISLTGSAIGLIAIWPVGRALRSLLYGVGSGDAIALVAAPVVMLATALLASLGPSRRAARANPADALRGD